MSEELCKITSIYDSGYSQQEETAIGRVNGDSVIDFNVIPGTGSAEWEIFDGINPIAEFVGQSGSGPYGNYEDPSDPYQTYTVEPIELAKEKRELNGKERKVSMRMTYDFENDLKLAALKVRALHGGKGSWRVLLRKIHSGEIEIKRAN